VTAWALYALTQNLAAQTKLHNELLWVSTDLPTMDELNTLPYLDCVIREALCIHAPIPAQVQAVPRLQYYRIRSHLVLDGVSQEEQVFHGTGIQEHFGEWAKCRSAHQAFFRFVTLHC
jgi:hypothetical protein